jgi:hypothetical protein
VRFSPRTHADEFIPTGRAMTGGVVVDTLDATDRRRC